MTLRLHNPAATRSQLVYRLENPNADPAEFTPPRAFVHLHSPVAAIRFFGALRRQFGFAGALKAVAKLAIGCRSLYLVTDGTSVISYGWCTLGMCKQYAVEPEAVVIGPIWTSAQVRGQGVATAALQTAVATYASEDRQVFYIDTADNNHAAQRVFAKCGFGQPITSYRRAA